MGASPTRLVEAVLVTADKQTIPVTVKLPAPPTFTIHRADGHVQVFWLDRASLGHTGATITYVEREPRRGAARHFLPICPVCGGELEPLRDSPQAALFTCVECDTGVVVPPDAWSTAESKRAAKWRIKSGP